MISNTFSANLSPFADLPFWAVSCVFASHFFGFFVRGFFGFGSNMVIVLLTTWLLGPHHAILLVCLTAFAAQAHLFPQGLRTADWEVVKPLLVGQVVGIGIGTWVFTMLASNWLTLLLGVLITSIVLMDRFQILEGISKAVRIRSPAIASLLATTSGTVGTVSGGGGIYFLVTYLKIACPSPHSLRGTNMVLSGFFMISRIGFLAIAGLFSGTLFVEAVFLLPAVFLGTFTGSHFFHASSAERFYASLQLLLAAAALALIARGIVKIF